jgi:DNA-binding CsgD family transcriptional regulator
MAKGDPSTVLTALGFSPAVERTYQRVLRQSGQRLDRVAAVLAVSEEGLLERLQPLVQRGIVRLVDGTVVVESPAQALGRLIVHQSEVASRAHADLAALARAVPFLTAGAARPSEGDVDQVWPIDGEVTTGGTPATLIASLLRQSKGDVSWLRPDQWRVDRESEMLQAIRDLVAAGRRSRAIYPVRILHEAPEIVRARAEAGEEIRVLPDIPTRMFVIGRSHAVLPEPMGFMDEPRSLVRQQGLVEALALLFDLMWDRAAPVPDLVGGSQSDLRRFLLEQLAAGQVDEQIAVRLGIGLRTVRRRVADLMTELGADTRFQAGVEAARRGWI